MSITLEFPPEVESRLKLAWGTEETGLSRHILEAVAVEGYRQKALSSHEVSQLLGLGFHETEAFLKNNGCYLEYDLDDLDADREANERFLGQVSLT